MIKLFGANEKDFSTAGDIIIKPLRCREFKKKSLNGWYIEVEISIKYKKYIKKDKLCVVKSKSKLNPQAFRIATDTIKYTNTKISFTANHVMFDSKDYFLVDVRPTNLNGLNALNYINQRTDDVSPFSFYSNVENIDTAYFIRKNLLEAWTKIEERWGGVFEADNWNISFLQKVGQDKGHSLIYGKDIEGIEVYEDWSNVITKLYPVGYNGLMLPEEFLESDIKYEKPYTRTVDFQTSLESEEQTEEKLIEELRTNSTRYLEENKYPKISYTVKSDVKQNLEIGDIIHVIHPLADIKTEVLEYEYDHILEKVKSTTFGNHSRDVKLKFDNIKNTIEKISKVVSNQENVINNQTKLINSLNKNGHVYIDDNEILILDKIPKEQAKNVWRFGLGGIGFSSNGYEGPFETAITMDGSINAKFITTGTMSVSRIEGLANKISEYDTNISEIILEMDSIKESVTKIQSFTRKITETNQIHLNETIDGQEFILKFSIKGDTEKFVYLTPSNELVPSNTLVPLGGHFTLVVDKQNRNSISSDAQIIDVTLEEPLRSFSDVYDELNIINGKTTVIRRIGLNKDLSLYILQNEKIEELPDIQLKTFEGDTYIYIKEYTGLEYFSKYIFKNDYSDNFATKVEMNSAITQSAENVNVSVDKKLEDYSTTTEMNAAINVSAESINNEVKKKVGNDEIISKINQSAEKVEIDANKISLKGKEINLTSDKTIIKSNNFQVDENGNMTCNDANIRNGKFNGTIKTGENFQVDTNGNMTCNNVFMDNVTVKSIKSQDDSFKFTSDGVIYAHNIKAIEEKESYVSLECTNKENKWKTKYTSKGMFIQNDGDVNAPRISLSIASGQPDKPLLRLSNGTIDMPNGNIQITGGQISAKEGNFFINNILATGYGFFDSYVSASEYRQSSDINLKENIHKLNSKSKNKKITRNALDIVKEADICEYNFKDNPNTSIGMVIGDNYNTPDEILASDKKGINLYSMISILWKAVQEQQLELEQLKERMNKYEVNNKNFKKANEDIS